MNKKCFMFMGQGSQKVGMGLDFYNKYNELKELFQLANDLFQADLTKFCFKGPEKLLSQTIHLQPIITVFNIFLYELFSKVNRPDYIIGHSLGEISALYASGVLNKENLFVLLKERASLMEEASSKQKGMMFSLSLSYDQVKELINKTQHKVSIALNNAPNQVVISGDDKELIGFVKESQLANPEIKASPIKVSGAWHSSLMQEIQDEFRNRIKNIPFNKPVIPLVMNVNAKITEEPDQIKENVILQFTSTVNWFGMIDTIRTGGSCAFYSVGLGKTLKGLMLNIDRNIECTSVDNIREFDKIFHELKN